MTETLVHHIADRTWLLFAYWADVRIAGWRFIIRSADDPLASTRPIGATSQYSVGVWLTVGEACRTYREGDVVFTETPQTNTEGGNSK